MKSNYKSTVYACYAGYVVQAIVNNFLPLLFLTFHTSYGIPLSKITMLVTINFSLQLITDFVSAGFIDKIGYRVSIVIAHVLAAAGLLSLTVLPSLFSDPFIGLIAAVMIYAPGGGLLEVLVSPIVEACPTDNKEQYMSLVHSFYCWGHVGVVLFSTLYFAFFGIESWRVLAMIWALVPAINAFFFSRVPIASLIGEDEKGLSIKELLKTRIFWVFVVLMVCSGASEQAVSQWASTFSEQGLGVSKAIGDLTGPMFFALMMGLSRLIYGKFGEKLNLNKVMTYCALLCMFSYLVISLSPIPVLALIGCGICGFSVGILWPGTFSMASAAVKGGGTAMFAFLALAGDLGCSAGPTFVGLISSAANDRLNVGILAALIFPAVLILGILLKEKLRKTSHI